MLSFRNFWVVWANTLSGNINSLEDLKTLSPVLYEAGKSFEAARYSTNGTVDSSFDKATIVKEIKSHANAKVEKTSGPTLQPMYPS